MVRKRSHRVKASPALPSPASLVSADGADAAPEDDTPPTHPKLPFPIVGIGASAGGLEPSQQLLKALPVDTGMAFVLIQHLSPTRESMLAEILGRATRMPVLTVDDGMPVEPNHVYVIPPAAEVELQQGVLRLSPRQKVDGSFRPIDRFLSSLAAEQGNKAIAVILSGTASDGTLGCEEVKAEGGITFAQDSTAQQDGMPRSAEASGCVDLVLPPDEIAREIGQIGKHPLVVRRHDGRPAEVGQDTLGGILELVRGSTGVDFNHYKHSTLVRRVTRRMVLHKIDGIKDYHRFVATTPAEVEALFKDILISVTRFFRNPEAFELLKTAVFPELTKDRNRHTPLRIWVLGCSTGEEAYSIAIAFAEYAARATRLLPIQVFASDLNAAGIEKARAGVYPKAIEQDVSLERLRRFFTESDGGYRVVKSIRDMVVFARHNALTDPPFSHVDLISCRNLLIYLDPTLQQRLIPILHYALQPGGFLLLGSSENLGGFRNLFEPIEQKQKLFQRKPTTPLLPAFGHPGHVSHSPAAMQKPSHALVPVPKQGLDPQREADRLLLSRYAPAGVLVNAELEILHFRGDTGPYLAPLPGRASLNLLRLLREGLVLPVRSAILKAKREGRSVRQEQLTVKSHDTERTVSVEVTPIKSGALHEVSYLVVFDDAVSARTRSTPAKIGRIKPVQRKRAASEIVRLEQELGASREYLQSVIEQQEAANEELQSSNEEVQSTNEELQSINEELETSKEEIQAGNEELATVNDELHTRNLELTQSNDDLNNLITSVRTPIVMLGPDLRIRRFTPSAEKLLNLIGSDIGRPLSDIKINLEIPNLEETLTEVMESASPREHIGQDKQGRWWSVRFQPYRTLENRIDGVVMMVVDIDSLKKAEATVRANAERLNILHDQAPLGIREASLEGRYIQVNARYCAITGYSREELLGRPIDELIAPPDRARAMELWRQVVTGEIESYRDEQRCLRKDGELIWVEINGFAMRNPRGGVISRVAFVQDITERKRSEAELVAADRSKNKFLAMLAHELRNPLAPLLNVVQLLGAPNLRAERIGALRAILERQIRNLSRMTDDLLDVSRISQGKMKLHREIVELGGIVRRAADLFLPSIESRGQTLTVSIPEAPINVDADPVRLEQVVDNLLTNASKFTEDAGNIWLTVSPPPSPDAPAEIRVRDDGVGILPELLPTIFDPFTQADSSLDRRRGGLGIGLTLVRSLVELHGGCVAAESKGAGQGSEFVVRLPVTSAAKRPHVPRARDLVQPPVHARKILIVDDNIDGADTLAMLLRVSGHQVRTLSDGKAVTQEVAEFSPDVVLLDIGLPGKDGFEVARELRANAVNRDLLLVAVSGYGQEEDRRRARAAGIDHYFTKPMDFTALLNLVAAPVPA